MVEAPDFQFTLSLEGSGEIAPPASDFTFPGVRQNTLWSRGKRALKKDPTAAALSVLDGAGSL
jgi:hypothetical protein